MSQEELDAVCEKCSLERLANEADGRDLRAREKALGALYGLVDRIRDRESSVEADRVGAEARAYLRALATVQVITERERESFAAAIEDAVKARTAPAERTTFEHLHPDLKRHRETAKIYALGLALAEKCPPNDCRVYLNIFNAARELDAILDFVVGLGLMALGGLGLAAACVVAGAPDSFTRAAALLGLGFMAAVNLHRQKRK